MREGVRERVTRDRECGDRSDDQRRNADALLRKPLTDHDGSDRCDDDCGNERAQMHEALELRPALQPARAAYDRDAETRQRRGEPEAKRDDHEESVRHLIERDRREQHDERCRARRYAAAHRGPNRAAERQWGATGNEMEPRMLDIVVIVAMAVPMIV